MMRMIYSPTIYQGPTWWQVLLIAVVGGVVALLALEGWERLVDWWIHRSVGGTRDTTADDPSRAYDARWRDQGKVPVVPDRPTEVVARWWATRHGLHLYGCRHAAGGEPLPYTYSAGQAAQEAEERRLRPCRSCNPLDALTGDDIDRLFKPSTPQDVTA